jgi:hypothetical protein
MKRMFVSTLASLVVLFITGSSVAWAHHGSRISYDIDHTVTLEGVVTEVDYVNPHVYLLFDVTDKDGTVVNWAAETLPPGMLAPMGWNKNSLKAGDKVVATMWPSKTGAPRGFLGKLVGPTGKVLFEHAAPTN